MSQDNVHIMIDTETDDTEETAVILSLGACTIRQEHQETYYKELSPQFQPGRTVSQKTQDWWKEQGNKPQGRHELSLILPEFARWIGHFRARPIIWCKGTDFDTDILANAYKSYRLPVPWLYNDVRDFRTIKKLHPQLVFSKNDTPHHALQDALCQTRDLEQILAYNPYLQLE